MASTKINIGDVVNSGSIVVRAGQKVSSTKNVVDDVNWQLDGKIKSRNNIGGRLSSLSGTLSRIESNIHGIVGAVEHSANGYLQADNRVIGASKELSGESAISTVIGAGARPLRSPDFSGNRPCFNSSKEPIVVSRADGSKLVIMPNGEHLNFEPDYVLPGLGGEGVDDIGSLIAQITNLPELETAFNIFRTALPAKAEIVIGAVELLLLKGDIEAVDYIKLALNPLTDKALESQKIILTLVKTFRSSIEYFLDHSDGNINFTSLDWLDEAVDSITTLVK